MTPAPCEHVQRLQMYLKNFGLMVQSSYIAAPMTPPVLMVHCSRCKIANIDVDLGGGEKRIAKVR